MLLRCLLAVLSWMPVDPYSDKPYLPTNEVRTVAEAVGIDAARGEFESASFLVRSTEPLAGLCAEMSELVGPEGARIPASAVDIRIVKVFWAGVSHWNSDRHGRNEPVTLTPRAILHDDGLVRVDLEGRCNYLRVDYADGPRYVDILSDGRKEPLKSFLEPFADAPALVPFDLPADFTKQFWLTVRTPRDARPGVYSGTVTLRAGGLERGIPLRLTVYPFELPRPRTHHDVSKLYMCGIMGLPGLREMHAKTLSLERAEKVLLNVYRSAAEHNVQFATGEDFREASTDDLAVRGLFIRYQAGLQMDRFFFGQGLDHAWYGGSAGLTPEQDAAACAQALARWRPYAELQLSTLRKYAGESARLTMFGRSEASVWGVRREQPFARELARLGMGMMAETGRDTSKTLAWGLDVANVSADSSSEQTRRWHAAGAEAVNYYAPATSVWNPDVWRRRGIRNWFGDYDGIFEMAWMHAANPWNQHIHSGDMYVGEALVLCDANGVVPTLAYEAYREIADDIAYFSLHRLLCEKALASSDPSVRALARSEWEWLERTEPDRVVDLTAFRREVARRCIVLQEQAGALAPERWTRPIAALETLPPVTVSPDEAEPEEAVARARYWCARLRRDVALKALDDEIARGKGDPERNAKLGPLFAAKLETMLTVTHFEEKFSRDELLAAEACRKKVFSAGGATPSQKFQATMRVVSVANDSGFADLSLETLEGARRWVDSLGNDPHRQGWQVQLDCRLAEAYRLSGEWKKAVKTALPLAKAEGVDSFRIGVLIGECAEKTGDFTTAALGYKQAHDALPTESAKERAHWQRELERVSAKIRKASPAASPDADDAPISLDED